MTRERTRSQTPPPVNVTPGLSAEMTIVQKRLDELIPANYNPRGMTPKEKEDIRDSIRKFKMVDPIIVNIHPDRMNIIVGGHQRRTVLMEEGYVTGPCVEVYLTEKEEKELNLRLNKNVAHWDEELLRRNFNRDELRDAGWTDSELDFLNDDRNKAAEALATPEAKYPIVPKVDEGYDSILIFCKSKIDMLFLKEFMEVDRQQSYKCKAVGETRVVSFEKFKEVLDKYVARQKEGQ